MDYQNRLKTDYQVRQISAGYSRLYHVEFSKWVIRAFSKYIRQPRSFKFLLHPTYPCFISGMSSKNAPPLDTSLCVQTSPHARVKWKIAALMEVVELLKQDRATKQRYIHCFLITTSSFNVSLSPGKWPIIFHRDKQFGVWWSSTLP
jgi:hypothetical protein